MVNGFKVAKIYVQKYLELYSYTRLTYKWYIHTET